MGMEADYHWDKRNNPDPYEDERFSGTCPTCGQEFLKEKAKVKPFNYREWALNRSIYDDDGKINYRVKFWHDMKDYYKEHPLIDDIIWKLLTGDKEEDETNKPNG